MKMTYKEVAEMISSIGLPTAYNQFPEKTSQAPPYICFYYPASADELYDNTNYVKVEQLIIELYVENKSFELERQVEAALRASGLTYTRTENWLGNEKLYLETYQMEVIINEQQD